MDLLIVPVQKNAFVLVHYLPVNGSRHVGCHERRHGPERRQVRNLGAVSCPGQ